jgi:glutamate decarboxylase
MENQVVWYLADIIWYNPEKAWGTIVSWGTMANLTAMMIARNSLLSNDWEWVAEMWIIDAIEDYNNVHWTDYRNITLLVWEDAHYSINKLAWYIWIGNKKIKEIKYNENHELDINHFENLIQEAEKEKKLIIWVFITAWTTEKWHIHNISEVMNVAKNIWQNWRELYVHVDAAHWWWYLVKDELKNKYFKDIEKADSVTIDWHKMLYTNYSCWWVIFKDHSISNNIKQSANYILKEWSLNENHGQYTIEGSRPTTWVFQLWSNINMLWKEWYEEIIDKTLENTQKFRELMQEDEEMEILSWDSPLNLVCFRFHPRNIDDEHELNKINKKLKDWLYKDWEMYVWDTEIDNKNCFRAVLMNHSIQEENLTKFISKLHELYTTI